MAGQLIDLDAIQAKIEAQQGKSAQPLPVTAQRALDRALVRTVWQLMGSMYGHRWVSSYGADIDPDNVWGAALAGVTEQQIRHGMRQCVQLGMDWPPSAPEFRKLCEGRSDHDAWEHGSDAYRPFDPGRALPDKTAAERNEEVAHRELSRIRAMLGMPPRVCTEAPT